MNTLLIEAVGARKYSFVDEKTGRTVEGVSVHHLQPVEGCVGLIPHKINLPYALADKVSKLPFPATYRVETVQELRSKGVVTKFIDLHPVK